MTNRQTDREEFKNLACNKQQQRVASRSIVRISWLQETQRRRKQKAITLLVCSELTTNKTKQFLIRGSMVMTSDASPPTNAAHGWLLFWIKFVVLIDMLAVSLVIPLMQSYFKDAGITTKGLGYMSSIYNVAQILGSLFIGGLMSDTCSKRSVLLLSFFGSAVSYLLLCTTSSLPLLFFSRALVGLVKQTFTVAYSVINEACINDSDLRSLEMGRLMALSNVCWTVGPSAGSFLYKLDRRLPSLVAATLFIVNACVTFLFIPRIGIMAAPSPVVAVVSSTEEHQKGKDFTKTSGRYSALWAPYVLFRKQFSDLANEKGVLTIIFVRILIIFTESAMSSSRLVNFYQNRFGLETSQLGYINTISNVVGTLIQTLLVNRIVKAFGGNSSMIIISLSVMSVTELISFFCPSYLHYAIFSHLPSHVAQSLMTASNRNIFSTIVPHQHFGKAQAVFSMLISCVGIVAPIYGSHIYTHLSTDQYRYKGLIHGIHLAIVTIIISFMIPGLTGQKDPNQGMITIETNATVLIQEEMEVCLEVEVQEENVQGGKKVRKPIIRETTAVPSTENGLRQRKQLTTTNTMQQQ